MHTKTKKVLKGFVWLIGGLALATIAAIVGFFLMLWFIHKYG